MFLTNLIVACLIICACLVLFGVIFLGTAVIYLISMTFAWVFRNDDC